MKREKFNIKKSGYKWIRNSPVWLIYLYNYIIFCSIFPFIPIVWLVVKENIKDLYKQWLEVITTQFYKE